jgi:hypothetical protein
VCCASQQKSTADGHEHASPLSGFNCGSSRRGVSDNVFEVALAKRVNEVLVSSGWIAAQPFRFATPPPSARPTSLAFTKYLVIWEAEGTHAQELQNTLIAATKTGEVKVLPADPATAQSSWWVTTSPFITKDDFQR